MAGGHSNDDEDMDEDAEDFDDDASFASVDDLEGLCVILNTPPFLIFYFCRRWGCASY
jgi:hypothetical protein